MYVIGEAPKKGHKTQEISPEDIKVNYVAEKEGPIYTNDIESGERPI